MNDIYNCNIKLANERCQSDFYNNLLKDEFNNIILNKNINNNYIQITNSFIFENKDSLEIGLYITNLSNKEIHIKRLPLKMYIDEDTVNSFVVDINKNIGSKEAIYKEIKLSKDESLNNINKEKAYICIDNLNKIKRFNYIDIDIKKLPKIDGYKSNREMKKFLRTLSKIEEDEFRIDVFKVGEVEEGFCILALARNSSDREINIKSLPITVYMENGLMIYKGIYRINDNSLSVGAYKGKFYSIVIPFNNFLKVEGYDLSKYKVEFK